MTRNEIYDLYVLQSKNVRQLKKVQANLNKDINFYIKKNDNFQIELKTKLLALLYSTLSEAQFIQFIHTPDGFSSSEISDIKTSKNRSLEEGWKELIDKAMSKVGDWTNNPDLQNRRNSLIEIVKEYIVKPSILRNKIAHGQWQIALNRENTNKNDELTEKLKTLDVVLVSKWFDVHQYMGLIIRDLIQSPSKGFHNNYWTNLTKLQKYLSDSEDRTFETKRALLMKKPIVK